MKNFQYIVFSNSTDSPTHSPFFFFTKAQTRKTVSIHYPFPLVSIPQLGHKPSARKKEKESHTEESGTTKYTTTPDEFHSFLLVLETLFLCRAYWKEKPRKKTKKLNRRERRRVEDFQFALLTKVKERKKCLIIGCCLSTIITTQRHPVLHIPTSIHPHEAATNAPTIFQCKATITTISKTTTRNYLLFPNLSKDRPLHRQPPLLLHLQH